MTSKLNSVASIIHDPMAPWPPSATIHQSSIHLSLLPLLKLCPYGPLTVLLFSPLHTNDLRRALGSQEGRELRLHDVYRTALYKATSSKPVVGVSYTVRGQGHKSKIGH